MGDDKEKYKILIQRLWNIYYNYNGAISSTNNIINDSSSGLKVNDEACEVATITKAANDLASSRASIYNLIMRIRNKG